MMMGGLVLAVVRRALVACATLLKLWSLEPLLVVTGASEGDFVLLQVGGGDLWRQTKRRNWRLRKDYVY